MPLHGKKLYIGRDVFLPPLNCALYLQKQLNIYPQKAVLVQQKLIYLWESCASLTLDCVCPRHDWNRSPLTLASPGLSIRVLDMVRVRWVHAAKIPPWIRRLCLTHTHTHALPAHFPETAGSTAVNVCLHREMKGWKLRTEINVAQTSCSSSPQTFLTNEPVLQKG